MSRASSLLFSLLLLGVLLAAAQGLFLSMRKTRRLYQAEAPAPAPAAPLIRPTTLPRLPGEGASVLDPRRRSGSVPMFVEKRPQPAALRPAEPEPARRAAPARKAAPAPRPMPKPLMRLLGGSAAQNAPGFDGGAPQPAPAEAAPPSAPADEPPPRRQALQQAPQPVHPVESELEPEAIAPARRPVRAVSHGGGAAQAQPAPAAPAGYGVEPEPEPEEGD
ncbi:MAG TPA: hypothetical protein DCM05_07865 [Elusimicrobia bacterium]|nr:hypothetical protein [Elusimicrobiota bacterium]